MASSLNKVCLIGRLGGDPEIRSFSNGGRVANFSIATTDSWKDKATGEKKEVTEWHRISIFNEHILGVVEKYVKKGDLIYLEGKLKTRKYTDKDKVEKYVTEIVLEPFNGLVQMLASKNKPGEAQQGGSAGGQQAATPEQAKADAAKMDDEIPF